MFSLKRKKDTSPIVCACMQVSQEQIEKAIENGAEDFDELQEQTGVGTGCGACIHDVVDMLENKKSD